MIGNRAPEIDVEDFVNAVDRRVGPLELKDRVLVLAEELYERLPGDYPAKVDLLVASLGPELEEGQGMFNDYWYLMPVARLVEEYGLEYPAESLAAIEQITMRHTGEYAIRPYLDQWHEQTMEKVRDWAVSTSHNVRRLASEGIRPRLPWAARFKQFISDPRPVIEVIENLIDDPSLYVRTSVANNLNDIAKDHPDLAVETAARWLNASGSRNTRWIVEKGLRSLIKKGDPKALSLVGAEADPLVVVEKSSITPVVVQVGSSAEITVVVRNDGKSERDVIVDYQVHFLKANGSLRPSVFKLGKATVPAGGTTTLRKRHTFKDVRSRTLYPGEQLLVAQVNGNSGPSVAFTLEKELGCHESC
ncbi:MAG: DNA alkylation repair protein [Corynebacterium sp.]|uniref:DNA alkylation repair protein n=1 Tax=Corynebacterium sp. TaxID=1720 RepID=UPI0026DBB729|nr:DNA alkylation repair protein [Corynebacterium sp.]MDO4761283.1 DNA alkylation repair protein [Corynebacterium sp.]